ncbi:hypothetical protein ACIODW_04390 [Streptomyces sp. NPDC087897]
MADGIETAGAAEQGRPALLQRALTAAGALTGSQASGVAVAEAPAALPGG